MATQQLGQQRLGMTRGREVRILLFRILFSWMISSTILAISFPVQFFFLFNGLVCLLFILIFILLFFITDLILTKLRVRDPYIYLVINASTTLLLGWLVDGIIAYAFALTVGITYTIMSILFKAGFFVTKQSVTVLHKEEVDVPTMNGGLMRSHAV